MGPSAVPPPAPGSRACQSLVTPERRGSKDPYSVCNHTAACTCPNFLSLLRSLSFQHMCFQGWPLILHLCALSGLQKAPEWQLCKLSAMSRCPFGRCHPLRFVRLLLSVSLCLFVENGATKRRLSQSDSQSIIVVGVSTCKTRALAGFGESFLTSQLKRDLFSCSALN